MIEVSFSFNFTAFGMFIRFFTFLAD